MKELEWIIKDYLIGKPPIKIVVDEDEPTIGEILDIQRDLVYGQVEISEEGKITSLAVDIEEILLNNDISLEEYEKLDIDDLQEIAEGFIEDFARESLHLTQALQWGDGTYLMTFEALDTRYNLPLPNSGATVEINEQGFLLSVNINQLYYRMNYPETVVTPEEAKGVLYDQVLVQPELQYVEDQLEVVYVPKAPFLGVNVSGELIDTNDLQEEQETLNKLTIASVQPTRTVEQLLGLTPDMVQQINTEEEKIWRNKDLSNNIFVKIEKTSEVETVYASSLPFNNEAEELSTEILKQAALEFLELTVSNIHEKFELEEQPTLEEDEDDEDIHELTPEEAEFFEQFVLSQEEEQEFEEDEEESDFIFEPFTTFSFIRKVNGLEISEYNVHIDVGIYSGLVKDCTIAILPEEAIKQLDEQPALQISLEQADRLYKENVQMTLTRIATYEDEFIVYDLAYAQQFADGEKWLVSINAMTGEILFEDHEPSLG